MPKKPSKLRSRRNSPQSHRFSPFPTLPKELRLKIWEYALLLHLRIVEIGQSEYDGEPVTIPTFDEDGNEYDKKINPNPFRSSAKLPPLLHTNTEARGVALMKCTPSFANRDEPPQIYFNPEIDTLYFPAWCWEYNISNFELVTPASAKATIRKIAIDNLVTYSDWEDGSINNQIQINEFPNLEEFLLVTRKPDETGCGCCHEFNGPEEGKIEFVSEPGDSYYTNGLGYVKSMFEEIKAKDEKWNVPKVARFVQLKRGGHLA